MRSATRHHARSVLPFGMGRVPLRPVFHMASLIGHTVPVWNSRDEFGDTDMLVETPEQGRSMVRALGEQPCVLLRGHGAACVGASIEEAAFVSIYVEENADAQLRMLPLDEPTDLSPGEIDRTAEVLRPDLPVRRTWEHRVARAGCAGIA